MQLEQVAEQLELAGSTIDDTFVNHKFLSCLPAEYNSVRELLRTEESVSRARIRTVLRDKFVSLTKSSKPQEGRALFAGNGQRPQQHGKNRRGDRRNKNGRHGHTAKNHAGAGRRNYAPPTTSAPNATTSSTTADVECYRCGKRGHYASVCPLRTCSKCGRRGHRGRVSTTSSDCRASLRC